MGKLFTGSKEIKANMMRDEAQRAWDEEKKVFVPRINTGRTASDFSGPISGWAEMIEAVIDVGWKLDKWSVIESDSRAVAYPLFVR